MGAASNYRRSIGAVQAAALLPLRELFFDDNDAGFWTYKGWPLITGPWPGGTRQSTLHYCDAVHPGEVVEAVSRAFYSTGTPEEGLKLWGCNEADGPLEVYDNGVLISTLGEVGLYNELLEYDLLDLRASDRAYGSYRPFGTSPDTQLIGMGKGWHIVTLRKQVNAQPGDTRPGGRRTYFDGGTVYTRDQTFS